jgi:hypothetical protein
MRICFGFAAAVAAFIEVPDANSPSAKIAATAKRTLEVVLFPSFLIFNIFPPVVV